MSNDLVDIGIYFSSGRSFTINDNILTFDDGFQPTEAQKQEAILEMTKKRKIQEIDNKYSIMRGKLLTDGALMSLVYSLKLEEAKAFHANEQGQYLLLQASVDAGEVQTLEAAAQMIQDKETALKSILAGLETERLGLKVKVKNAINLEELEGIKL